jgi:hypothetical protein
MVRTALVIPLSLLVLLVACDSEETAEPGSPCKADLSCGGGLVCNFQAAMPICLDEDLDEDADGLSNKQDLCPATAGGSNHDEDGDKQGDSCDLCPIEAARGIVKDEDNDKLGGLCDPDDKEPGDKIIFFETFASIDALTGWMLDDASHYSISNDQLKVTVSALLPAADAVRPLPIAPQSAAVFTAYRVDNAAPADVNNASRDVNIALFDNSPAAGDGRARCGASSTSGAEGTLRLTTNRGEVNERIPASFVAGDTYRMLLNVVGGQAACVHIRGQASASASKDVESGQKQAIAVGVRSVAASYDYVMVVSSPQGR